MVLGGLRVARP